MRLARRPLLGTLTCASLVLVLSTCELSKVLSTPAPRKVVLSFPSDSTLIMGSGVKPTLQVTIDGDPIIDPEIRFVSSDTSVVAIGPRGDSLIARKLGAATITASLQGTLLPDPRPSASDTIYVVPKELTIAPAAVTFSSLGDSVTLTAIAIDANNQVIPNVPVTWQSSDPAAVSVSALGVVVAKTNTTGPTTVSGKLAGFTVTAPVTVAQQLDHFVFSPSRQTLDAIGATVTITAGGRDRRDNDITGLTGLEWQSGNGGVLSVTPAGVVTALDNGLSFVRVSRGPVSDTVDVDVEQQATNVDIVASAGVAIRAVGGTLRLVARSFDRRDIEVRQKKASWISLDGNVARVDTTGLVEALGPGTARIIARVDAAVETVTVVVTDEPAEVIVTPATAAVTSVGATLQLSAAVRNAVGGTVPLAPVTWSALDPAIATVSASGLVSALSVGVARIVGTSGAASDTASVTITNVPDQVDIIPAMVTLASVNDQDVPAVTVTSALGVALDRSTLLWSSDDPLVARVTLTGTIIATGAGVTFIKAVSPGNISRRDSVLVTVTNAPFTIVLNAETDLITAVGRTRTYFAEVRNAAGALIVDYPVEFRSTVTSVATVVPSTGLVTTVGIGGALIIAQAGTKADTVQLTVLNTPVSVELTPAIAEITSLLDVIGLQAIVRNDLEEVIPNSSVSWRSIDETVATVNALGQVTGLAVGTTKIIVTAGTHADTTVLTVSNHPAQIDILDASVSLTSLEDSIAPAATIKNGLGVTLPRTAPSWSSDDPSIARVSSSGMIVARDVGTTNIRATSGSVTDVVEVVVTNAPASVVLDGVRDTLTKTGQIIGYTATVRNAANAVITTPNVAWTSTTGSASVTPTTPGATTANATALANGTTLIIASAGVGGAAKADTVTLVVMNPTRLYVDNSSVAMPRVGTIARPFVAIQEAVNAADVLDVVIVKPGNAPYSETVNIAKNITVIGDSAAFAGALPAARDPELLPLISHDTGAAGIIVGAGGATIKYLALRHTLDGPAIDANNGNLTVEWFYVNPGASLRTGRGISVKNPPSISSIKHSFVNAVRGFGVRVEGANLGATLNKIVVTGVDSVTGTMGSGIEIVDGVGNRVDSSTIRGTKGSQIQVTSSASVRIRQNDLAGRHQLVRITGTNGITIDTNSFNLALQLDDPDAFGSLNGGNRSGLKIANSSNVAITGNSFDEGVSSHEMDAIHLSKRALVADTMVIFRNHFVGGRFNVRSDTATWRMDGSHSNGADRVLVTSFADTVVLVDDTLTNALSGCVQIRGVSASFSADRVRFDNCATSAVFNGMYAIDATPPPATTLALQPALRIAQSSFRGTNQTAVFLVNGKRLLMTEDTLIGTSGPPLVYIPLGAVNASPTDTVTLSNNIIREYASVAALSANGSRMTLNNNRFTQNKFGLRSAGGWTVSPSFADNEIFDNDTAGVNNTSVTSLSVNDVWWGDERGSRRYTAASSGDTIMGAAPGVAPAFRMAPVNAGTVASALLKARTPKGISTATLSITVRVVDAQGRPVPNVNVTFSCPAAPGVPCTTSGTSGGSVRRLLTSGTFVTTTVTSTTNGTKTVQTDQSGIAEILLQLNGNSGFTNIQASVVSPSLTLIVVADGG